MRRRNLTTSAGEPGPALLTAPAVAKRLGYRVEKAREIIEAGAFPGAFRNGVNGHWRVPAADVEAFIVANRPRVLRKRPA